MNSPALRKERKVGTAKEAIPPGGVVADLEHRGHGCLMFLGSGNIQQAVEFCQPLHAAHLQTHLASFGKDSVQ